MNNTILARRLLVLACTVLVWVSSPAVADLADTLARIKPSLVAVGTYQRTRNPGFSFSGTGFVVGDGTLVATSAHVLKEILDDANLETYAVAVAAPAGSGDGRVLQARRVAVDRERDVAILRLDSARLPAIALREGEDVREGQAYAFSGFALGEVLGFFPVTRLGIISSIAPAAIPVASARQLKDGGAVRQLAKGALRVYQLDASAHPGHSGSPLFDPERGDVVGIINMLLVSGTRDQARAAATGIPYAIPIRHLRDLIAANR